MPKHSFAKEYQLLGKKLKTERQKAHLEQTDIARELGKTQSDISKLESGKLRINIFELLLIAKLLKKPIQHFLP